MVIHTTRVRINRVRLPILLVVSRTGKMNISLSPFAPENLVSRDGFGSFVRVSLLISILRLNVVLTYGIPPDFRDGVHLFIQTAIRHGTSPELSRHAFAYRWHSLPRVRRQTGAALAGHHGPINLRLSFPHPLLV